MDAKTLEKLIELADAHQTADEYQAGHYALINGKACAVGCTINDAIQLNVLPQDTPLNDRDGIAEATGLPEVAWMLCDHIFEALPLPERSRWTPRFLRSIKPNADYSNLEKRIQARVIEFGYPCLDSHVFWYADMLCDELARVE